MTDLTKLKAINILDIADRLDIAVKQVGSNYSSNCPFHNEKTPSFVLFMDTNTFRCFGSCHQSGSNIDLIMKRLDMSFSGAIDWLKENYGTEDETIEIKLKLYEDKPKEVGHRPVPNDTIKYWHSALFYSKRYVWFKKRGFTLKTVKKEGFGWSGDRYVIPVWQDKPWESNCVGVRLRASELLPETAFKYIGKRGHNKPCIYNRHTIKNLDYMFVFAGELDAKLCSQDGFPAVSIVNGMTSFNSFPKNWAYLWFPQIKRILVVFDRKEAHIGGRLAAEWERQKGRNTAEVIHWPIGPIDRKTKDGYDDYNEFSLLSSNSKQRFLEICQNQLGDNFESIFRV